MKKIFFLFLFAALMGARGYAQTDTTAWCRLGSQHLPKFLGGDDSLQAYLKRNIHYPESAKAAGKEGTVIVLFKLETDGSVTNVEVTKPIEDAPEMNAEAKRAVETMPKWEPAYSTNGNPMVVYMSIPIKFTLPAKEDN